MNSEDFNRCRDFLEQQIASRPDDKDVLSVYLRLIDLKSQHDLETQKHELANELRRMELEAGYSRAVHHDHTDFNKAVHQNNTNCAIAYNNNQAAVWQNGQNQYFGALNNAVNTGALSYQR